MSCTTHAGEVVLCKLCLYCNFTNGMKKYKKNKIDRLITCHGFKNGRKDEQCSQTGDVIFSSLIPLAVYTLFGSVVKKPFGSCMYPEYPVLDKRYKDYKEFSFDMIMNHYWINIPFSD